MPRSLVGFVILVSAASGVFAAPLPVQQEGTTPYVLWSAVSELPTNEMHDPLAVNDLVIVGTNRGDLRAFRATTGKEAWSYPHGGRIFHRPCTDGERVFFSGGKEVAAVTLAGEKVWSFPLSHKDAPPVYALREAGLVFTPDPDGTLYALDVKTGQQVWKSDFVADAPPDPPGFAGDQFRDANRKARPTALASDGDAVYLSVFDQSRVVAFSTATGKQLWSYQTGGWMWGAAIATANHVFIGSQDKCFYGLDKKTGKPVWKFATKARVESGGAVDDKYVYFGSCDGSVYCLSQADGKVRWKFDTDRGAEGTKSAIYSVPVLRRGTVCVAAGEGQLYGIVAETGALRWKLRAEEKSDLYSSPATDGRSFFVTTRPKFAANGKQKEGVASLVAIDLK